MDSWPNCGKLAVKLILARISLFFAIFLAILWIASKLAELCEIPDFPQCCQNDGMGLVKLITSDQNIGHAKFRAFGARSARYP